MYFVGLDAHHRTSSYCMMNSQGQVVKQGTIRGGQAAVACELAPVTVGLRTL